MKKIYLTDEEVIKGKGSVDLHEVGEFAIGEARYDEETFSFEMDGTLYRGNQKIEAIVYGQLDPVEVKERGGIECISDIVANAWVWWSVDEA